MANIQPRRNKDGKIISYSIRVFKGRDSNGKQLKPFTLTFNFDPKWSERKIQAELQKAAIKFEEECKKGTVSDNKQTFSKYADYVLNEKERNGTKHRTIIRYKELLIRINAIIGHIKLADLRPLHINKLNEELSADGLNKKTGGKLSNKTILEHHKLISTILKQAEKEMLINFNSAQRANAPKVQRKEAKYFEIEDIENILFYAQYEKLKWKLALYLLVYTGCRRGEIMGLKWNKVDFKNSTIKIDINLQYTKEKGIYEETPKTEQSKRPLALPPIVMNLLRQYRTEYKEKQLLMGSKWYKTDFIFTQENGKPMHPDTLTDYCRKFTKKYNDIINKDNENRPDEAKIKLLPHIYPHKFRHSQAPLLLPNGVDIATISRRLGHANITTTANIYSHILDNADRNASNILENILSNNKKELTNTKLSS